MNQKEIYNKLKQYLQIIREYIVQNKKRVVIISSVLAIMIISFIIIKYLESKKLEIERNTDVSNAIHGIVISDYTQIYNKAKSSTLNMFDVLKKGDNTYILEEIVDNKNNEWYKVKYENRVGYILKENIAYFQKSDAENVLVSDVSKFNIEAKDFQNTSEYQIFLLENNIQYVYIRAGGRGYGEEGNFYTDSHYPIFIDACEYLKIPYGFYYIDEALTSEEIDEEVAFIENFLRENSTSMCKLPLALDIENHDGKGRADYIWEDRVFLAEELVQKFRAKGINTIVYTNARTGNDYLANVSTAFWVAYYPEENQIPNYWYSETDQEPTENIDYMNKIVGWQFTENGVGNIIKQKVDLSLVKNSFFSLFTEEGE